MKNTNTNSVQIFIRTAAFLSVFIVLGMLLPLLGTTSEIFFGNASVLVMPMLVINLIAANIVAKMFFVLPEWQKIVLLRLGKFHAVRGAGFFIIPPFIYSTAAVIDTRIEVNQVEATNTLTQDNVPSKVTAAIEFRVEDPRKAVIDVFNYRASVTWLATEALKNTIGSLTLKQLLSEREQISESLKNQIDAEAVQYGVDVMAVRITDIDTPPSLVEELAVIARAQRAAEAKNIQAKAELAVAGKLKEASELLAGGEGMRLRELQILSEVSKEESSMVIVYPYGDRGGEGIASATAGNAHLPKKPHVPVQK